MKCSRSTEKRDVGTTVEDMLFEQCYQNRRGRAETHSPGSPRNPPLQTNTQSMHQFNDIPLED